MKRKILIDAMLNGVNTTLTSQRRMGKTMLIRHVFNKLKENKNIKTIYFEIMGTTDIVSFVSAFGKAIYEQTMPFSLKSVRKIGSLLRGFYPSLKFDQYTTEPSLELKYDNNTNESSSLDNIFKYIKRQDEHYIIAIDEFQQITNYPQKNMEAVLRSYIQNISNANFIFSGSRKHILSDMFFNYSRPFYQSTQFIGLDIIAKEKYVEFINIHFGEGRKKIDSEAMELIFEIGRMNTYYVHLLCNRIYQSNHSLITKKVVLNVFNSILQEQESLYYGYKNFLTDNQWELLKAISKANFVEKPNSKEFLNKYSLGAASSVQTALNSLIDKEMLVHDNGRYFLPDVFFSEWLKRK